MLAPIATPTAAPDLASSGGSRDSAGRTGGFADTLDEVRSADTERADAAEPRDRPADPAAAVPLAAATPLIHDGMNAIRFTPEADDAVAETAALEPAAPDTALLKGDALDADAPDGQHDGAAADADMPADFAALLRQNGNGADQRAGQQGAPAQLPESGTASAAGEADPALLDALTAADAEPARAAGPTAQAPDATASGAIEMRQAASPTPAAQQGQTAAQTAPVPLDAVAVRIAKSAADGIDRMRIELHPASLGGIDVSLEIGRDGRVDAVIRADRPETLELMQRDARQLARALQDAGLQADLSSFDFRQREDGAEGFAGRRPDPAADRQAGMADPMTPAATIDLIYRSARAGGLDLRV